MDIARRKRRSFTAEFKAAAVAKVLKEGLSVAQVAQALNEPVEVMADYGYSVTPLTGSASR